MANFTPKELLEKTIVHIEGAYAPSSIRAYESDFTKYIAFCESNYQEVFPPNPMVLASFIAQLSDKKFSSASIRRAVAGISAIYRLNRMPDPSKDPEVLIAMKRMHRSLGRAGKQAHGITSALLEKLLLSTDQSIYGIRNRALLLVAYDTLCRRSELVSLQVQDIRFVDGYTPPHMTILLRRSKSDQESTGRWLHFSNRTEAALEEWLTILKEVDGPLFRGIGKNRISSTALNSGQVNRIFKAVARNALLDEELVKNISGHSCRVGAAQDLVATGASLPLIMSKGRWSKTDTVMRYVEHLQAPLYAT